MWTVVFLIYLVCSFFYVITDWNHEKQEAYAIAKSNAEADDAGLIVYWLLSFVFWPIILILQSVSLRNKKNL